MDLRHKQARREILTELHRRIDVATFRAQLEIMLPGTMSRHGAMLADDVADLVFETLAHKAIAREQS